jgi:glucose-6-phosphate-specific signal transduction histidine kinase
VTYASIDRWPCARATETRWCPSGTKCRCIHPPALAQGGLHPALKSLARRSTVPVRLDVRIEGRLPEQIEVAYYAIAEAVTNAAKHAQASVVDVAVDIAGGMLRVRVRDNGSGGANPRRAPGWSVLAWGPRRGAWRARTASEPSWGRH